MISRTAQSVLSAAVLSVGSLALAGDLFEVSAIPTSGTPIIVSDKSVINLVNDLVDQKAQFAPLADADFTSSLKYAGLADAITFSKTGSAGSRTVTLTIPSTGFSKTFTDAPGNDVQSQIEDFLKKDGATEVAKFIQKMNELTLAGVTDGNPLATTAIMARQTYMQFGLRPSPFQLNGEGFDRASDGGYEFRADFNGGVVDTDTGNGYFGTLSLDSSWRFNDTVALTLDSPFTYRTLEGSTIYQFGLIAGLPIRIIPGKGDNSISWTLTPSGLVALSGSADLVSGGLLWGAAATSSLTWTINGFSVTLANQYGVYQGIPVTFGDYKFETDVDQQILRNGIQVQQALGDGFIDAGIAYANFLNDAAVDHYWSPTVGIGFRFGKGKSGGVRIGYAGELGDGFTVHGADASLFVSF